MDMQGDSNMQAAHQAQVTFYLTGRSIGEGLDAVAGLGLRPALLTGYRDLTALRYDFPLVLLAGASDAGAVRSLTELFDAALDAALDGESNADRLRHHAARMEREMRRIAAADGGGGFAAVWQEAAQRLGTGADEGFADSLARLRAKLPADGEVAECDASLPCRLFAHAWAAVHRRKAALFRADLTRLIQKLSDILRADFARSDEGHSAENLRAAIGQPQAQAFDFAAMSRMLASVSAALPAGGQPPRAHPLAAVGTAIAALLRPAPGRRRTGAGVAGIPLHVRQLQPSTGSLARAAAQAGGADQGDRHRRAGGEG